ncbi:hypothetical protein [Hoeflea sp.]|uniref:hypothetical protein n=1 Tax=Hoeflea sp. TaxID=1940281 RepID=UPI003A931D4C
MNETTCPIWGTKSVDFAPNFWGRDITSSRAGGHYQIDGIALEQINFFLKSDVDKAKLSLRISDSQNLDEPIRITTETLEQIACWPNIRPFEKANRLLRWIERNTTSLDDVGLQWDVLGRDKTQKYKALAASCLINEAELDTILEYLERKGFCKADYASGDTIRVVRLTLEGSEEVAAPVPASHSRQAFIAMWFSPETQAAFDDGIKPALSDLGFDARRIDQKEHNNKIDDEIIAEIRQSRFLVADFTCGIIEAGGNETAIARGGVYFEAGFAMGLGIPVIWCCREDLINQVHFDTRQYNHITWNTSEELREKLKNRVGAVIGSYSGKQHS